MLLNPPESNCTNNYLASKAFATMTHQVAHRVTHGLFCKMRNIRSPYLASCGIVLSERTKRAKVFQRCKHCTTTKVHTLQVNCLKVQSGRAARKNRTKNTSLQRESTFKREKRYEILLMFKRENWRKFFRLNQLFHHHQYFPKHCILCPS